MKQKLWITCTVLALFAEPSDIFAASKCGAFMEMDKDKDGQISKHELIKADLAIISGINGEKKVVHRNVAKDDSAVVLTEDQKQHLLQHLDTDNDGVVTRKEWDRASPDGFVIWRF